MPTKSEPAAALETIVTFLSSPEMVGREIVADEELITGGALDSLKIMSLVAFVEESFQFNVKVEEVVPENFETANSIAAFVVANSDSGVQDG